MANSKIQDFFNRKFFEIPKYQRGYAWTKENIRELFNDIQEAEEVSSNHYIGTIVLSKSNINDKLYYVVDGQQRIATILMIINSIVSFLKKDDSSYYSRFYIKEGEHYRLKLLGKEENYFIQLLKGKNQIPKNKSQRLLNDAYEEIVEQVSNYGNQLRLLNLIEELEVLQFVEDSEGDAIRIFQTVNDRGRPLSNMEKAKSHLVYFSNRYLNKKLDNKINNAFGEIFDTYDEIKFTGEALGINLISSDVFNEDSVMRYHFITYSEEDYDASANYVLNFLKRELKSFRKLSKDDGYKKIETFIDDYIHSLNQFSNSLNRIIQYAKRRKQYFKLLSILNLSATLYPLITKLEMLGILDKNLPGKEYSKFTFLDLIELIDVRIYKTRGTDPRAEISRFTYSLDEKTSLTEIQNWLVMYNKRWMSKAEFQTYLNSYIYGNRALPHIFIEFSEQLSGKNFTIEELKQLALEKKLNPTIEHILSQKPKFTLRTHGFKSTEEYLEYEDTLGNLTVLEKALNSSALNKNTFEKVKTYDKSCFKMTKIISTQIAIENQFKKNDIEQRTKELSEYLIKRWWC